MVAHKLYVFVLASVAFSSVFAAPIGTDQNLHDVSFGVPPTPEQLASLLANAEGIAATTPAGGVLSTIAGQGLPALGGGLPSLGGGLPKLPRDVAVGGQSIPAVGGTGLPALPVVGGALPHLPRGLPAIGGTGLPVVGSILPNLPGVGGIVPRGLPVVGGTGAPALPALPVVGGVLPHLPRDLPVTPGLPTPPTLPVVGSPGLPTPPTPPTLPVLPKLPLPGAESGTGLTGATGSNTVQPRDNKGGLNAGNVEYGLHPEQVGTVPTQLHNAEGIIMGTVGPVGGIPGGVVGSPKDVALGTAKGAASDLGVLQMGSSGKNGGVSVNGNTVEQ